MLPSFAIKSRMSIRRSYIMAMKLICPSTPGVAVGDLLQEVRLFVKGFAADFDVHAEIGTDVERRIDVDELEAAGSSIC